MRCIFDLTWTTFPNWWTSCSPARCAYAEMGRHSRPKFNWRVFDMGKAVDLYTSLSYYLTSLLYLFSRDTLSINVPPTTIWRNQVTICVNAPEKVLHQILNQCQKIEITLIIKDGKKIFMNLEISISPYSSYMLSSMLNTFEHILNILVAVNIVSCSSRKNLEGKCECVIKMLLYWEHLIKLFLAS